MVVPAEASSWSWVEASPAEALELLSPAGLSSGAVTDTSPPAERSSTEAISSWLEETDWLLLPAEEPEASEAFPPQAARPPTRVAAKSRAMVLFFILHPNPF